MSHAATRWHRTIFFTVLKHVPYQNQIWEDFSNKKQEINCWELFCENVMAVWGRCWISLSSLSWLLLQLLIHRSFQSTFKVGRHTIIKTKCQYDHYFGRDFWDSYNRTQIIPLQRQPVIIKLKVNWCHLTILIIIPKWTYSNWNSRRDKVWTVKVIGWPWKVIGSKFDCGAHLHHLIFLPYQNEKLW